LPNRDDLPNRPAALRPRATAQHCLTVIEEVPL
jgi:hypothetical protein